MPGSVASGTLCIIYTTEIFNFMFFLKFYLKTSKKIFIKRLENVFKGK